MQCSDTRVHIHTSTNVLWIMNSAADDNVHSSGGSTYLCEMMI